MDEKTLLQRMMVDSLNTLYDKDQYLIWNHKRNVENHVSERGLMFRFGIYFDMLARVQFPEYHVDSEYNRNLADLKMLPSWKRGCYPDLILHKRGKNTKNLLVIEAKTWWNSDHVNRQ